MRVGALLAATAASLGLYGWGDSGTRTGMGHRQPAVETTAPAPAPMATRHYVGKPRPPVRVLLAAAPALEAGVPGELTIAVQAGMPITRLRLAVDGSPGLAVTGVERLGEGSGTSNPETASLREDLSVEYRILATPTSGGSPFLAGHVEFTVDGVAQAAPFHLRVPVQGPPTTSADPARNQAPLEDQTGEKIRILAAETTSG